jgi:hypothetical protein
MLEKNKEFRWKRSVAAILFGRSRTRWEDDIKMVLMEIGCDDRRWMVLDQDHVQWWILERPYTQPCDVIFSAKY